MTLYQCDDGRKLGYDWRLDGMFLCKSKCIVCGKEFDTLAIAPWTDKCPDHADRARRVMERR